MNILIAGHTSEGKTTTAVQMAFNLLTCPENNGKVALVYNAEFGNADRFWCWAERAMPNTPLSMLSRVRILGSPETSLEGIKTEDVGVVVADLSLAENARLKRWVSNTKLPATVIETQQMCRVAKSPFKVA